MENLNDILKLTKNKWEELEDQNQHAECALLLAEFSGHASAIKLAKCAMELQQHFGCLLPVVYHLRLDALRFARDHVVKIHGEPAAFYLFGPTR